MEPLNDKRFLKYLLIFGVVLMTAWTIFIVWILPILPDTPWKGLLATVGGGVIMIVLALLVIQAYEKGEEGEEGED